MAVGMVVFHSVGRPSEREQYFPQPLGRRTEKLQMDFLYGATLDTNRPRRSSIHCAERWRPQKNWQNPVLDAYSIPRLISCAIQLHFTVSKLVEREQRVG